MATLGASPYPGVPHERLVPLLAAGYRFRCSISTSLIDVSLNITKNETREFLPHPCHCQNFILDSRSGCSGPLVVLLTRNSHLSFISFLSSSFLLCRVEKCIEGSSEDQLPFDCRLSHSLCVNSPPSM